MSNRESSDDYEGIVAILSDRWRVIDSLESHPYRQWIVQYQYSMNKPNCWTTRPPYGAFWQTKSALMRDIKEKGLEIPAEILNLPDHIRNTSS